MVDAVIFDLDGTILDTEKLWGEVGKKVAAHYGCEFDTAVRVRMMGRPDRDALTIFREHHDIKAPVEEIIAKRREIILSDLSGVNVNAGVFELLDLLERLNIPRAIATSSFKELVDKVLAKFDLTKHFHAILTAEDVVKGKPNPEMFLKTAARLNAEPKRSLVLEDAQNGVEAAHAAGMAVFAIPHDSSRHHDFSKATKVLRSLLEVDEALLRSL
jgi:HAD superfamily hydrolase (TIGR01549 family)